MKKNRIGYLLFVLVGIYLLVLYDEYVSLVMFLLLLVMPFFPCLCFPFWKRKIEVRSGVSERIIKMGEECKFTIQLTNQSIFPITNGTLQVRYRHQLDEAYQEKKIWFHLDGKSSEKVTVTFSGSHCGMVELFFDKVRVYDYFGLASVSLFNKGKKGKIHEVMVVPEFEYTEEEQDVLAEENQEITIDAYGEDSSEVKGIREYRQGDPLKNIHWKLSSKQRQLMVKEYSQDETERERFIFSLLYEEGEDAGYDWYDEKMDELVNTSMSLLVEQRPHEVVWYHPKGKYFETTRIDLAQDIGFLVEKVIREGIGQKEADYELLLKEYLLSHLGAR